MSKFIPVYDLESMNEEQRQEYVKNVCEHMGVPSELNLVMLTYLDEQDGPRRLVAYAKRGATEIIRNNRSINVTDLTSKEIGGSIVFTATGKDSTGRQEMSTGSRYIKDLVGRELDDAIMTAQTRATRRMTLQFVGAGVLDESEVNPANTVVLKNTTPVSIAPQPIVKANDDPGKDVTSAIAPEIKEAARELQTSLAATAIAAVKIADAPAVPEETQEQFNARMDKLRQEAIAQLNAKHLEQNPPAEAPKKTKRTRGPNKPKVDLGPSAPVPQVETKADIKADAPAPVAPVTPAPTLTLTPPVADIKADIKPVPAPPPSKAKLTPEQVKPFRQRLFRLVNDQLEPAGFSPKEGMGNAAKMKNLAGIMFADVNDMNELTAEQWEKYLTTLENKVKSEGAAATVKYIEDAIGV